MTFTTPPSSRVLALLLLAASIIFLAIFSAPLFNDEIYIEHDVGAVFAPLRWFYAQCLQSGDAFLWIPNIYAGFYLHGEGQTGMTHPLHVALYKFLPFTAAFDLEFILSYPFMFIGMLLFLRRWKLPPEATLFGAFLYTFSGYSMASWLWMVHIAVLAHTPWLLWLIDITLRDKSPRKIAYALLGIVALTTSQLLISYPQMVYVTGLVEGLYALFIVMAARFSSSHTPSLRGGVEDADVAVWSHEENSPYRHSRESGILRAPLPTSTPHDRPAKMVDSVDRLHTKQHADSDIGFNTKTPRHLKLLTALLTAKLLAITCAAIQLLPTLHVVQQSTRIDTDDAFRLQQSLHPANLLCLVNPYLFQQRMYDAHGYQGIYGGATVTALALWLILRWRRLIIPRAPVACFALIALLGTILTLGKYGLLYTGLSSLPILEYFRGPPRHGAMVHAGLAALAAFAIAEIVLMKNPATRREWLWLFALPVIAAIPVAFIIALRASGDLSPALAQIEEQFAPSINPLTGLALMLVATAATIAAIRHWRYGLLALIAITIADQGFYHLRHRTTQPLDEFIAAVDIPDAPPEHRIEPNWKPVYDVNGPLMKGYSMVTGLVSIEPHRSLDYKVDPYTLQLAGVKWMRARYGENESLNAWYDQGIEWIELPNPMPRARLLTKAQLTDNPNEDIRTIDYTTTALVENEIDLPNAPPGEVTVTKDRPGDLQLRTNAPTQQLLTTTEAFHDGWHLSINNTPANTLRTNGDFLGALIPSGENDLHLTFTPWSWKWGKRITLMGTVLTALLFAMARTLRIEPAHTTENSS